MRNGRRTQTERRYCLTLKQKVAMEANRIPGITDCNTKGVTMSREYNPFYEDSFLWSVARQNVRDIIEEVKDVDAFYKGTMAYHIATDTFVELLQFFKDEKIIDGWDADALTSLLDSMCIK